MTGRNDDRPDFKKMIKDSSNGAFNYVLVYKLDRFSRNRYDSAVNKKILKDNGVKVLSATEQISDIPEGIIFESIIEGYSEYYSAELAQKVTRGLTESRLKGQFTGGVCNYGYKVVDKKYVINEDEATIVRRIFNEVIDGRLLKDIIADLNNTGLYRRGKKWTANHISRIVTNPKYIGIDTYNGVEYNNIIPPIVDEELFNKAKATSSNNRKRNPHFRGKTNFLLSGILYCGYCGKLVIGESGTGKLGKVYNYYKCSSIKNHKANCGLKNQKKVVLEDLIIEKIIQYILQVDYIPNVAITLADIFNDLIKDDSEELYVKKALAKVNKEIDNLINVLKKGIVSDAITSSLADLENQKKELEIEELKLKSKKARLLTYSDSEDFLYSLTELDFTNEYNKGILIKRFVKKVTLYKDKVDILFYPADKVITEKTLDDNGDNGSGNDDSNDNVGSPTKSFSPPFDFVDEHPTLEYVDWLLTLSINLKK